MFVKIWTKPADIVIVQGYMPSTDHNDDETEKMYDEISEILYIKKEEIMWISWG